MKLRPTKRRLPTIEQSEQIDGNLMFNARIMNVKFHKMMLYWWKIYLKTEHIKGIKVREGTLNGIQIRVQIQMQLNIEHKGVKNIESNIYQ